MDIEKKIIIIAGPNGAGKTTFAKEFLPHEADCPTFINADLIAASLSPTAPESVAIPAGRMMLDEIDRRVESCETFAFETTLSGRSYARRIPSWREVGYHVKLIFLSLPDAELAIARVARRVIEKGHNIPPDVIRRRFLKGRENFELLYKPLVDSWIEYNNGGGIPIAVDEGYRL
ncbi:MAG: zeta toxin family protein [Planctomycetes bacterium]|nr:zeta toxin family protein [Planctomycetota bacterium]